MHQNLEREPTNEELAQVLKISTSEVKKTLEANMRQLSMDAPFANEDDNSLLDMLMDETIDATDKNLTYTKSLSVEAERSLSALREKDKEILKMFFGIGRKNALSLEKISDELGLTRERVRQLKEKSLRELRTSNKSNNLVEYLG
jgi:RNA polymerase primary sigma factor